jgi:membrane-associated protein
LSTVAVSGILGNIVGYWFGSKVGIICITKKDTFWFKKKYLVQSKDFFDKHGEELLFCQVLTYIQNFCSIVAGIVTMDKKKFMYYNVISSFLWSFTLIFAGHYLYGFLLDSYQIDLKNHIELIILGLVILTLSPVLLKFAKKKTKSED